ncbi:hypothetical protein PIB19_07010 [Sphingomonas sp. 7/4-4]|nr:hypothetical protein [Sphingomonas sp. 7/4-4]WBY09098.1 hypothetical protein PIB19_07010 [Sphingomonas sp. 7/4-4]
MDALDGIDMVVDQAVLRAFIPADLVPQAAILGDGPQCHRAIVGECGVDLPRHPVERRILAFEKALRITDLVAAIAGDRLHRVLRPAAIGDGVIALGQAVRRVAVMDLRIGSLGDRRPDRTVEAAIVGGRTALPREIVLQLGLGDLHRLGIAVSIVQRDREIAGLRVEADHVADRIGLLPRHSAQRRDEIAVAERVLANVRRLRALGTIEVGSVEANLGGLARRTGSVDRYPHPRYRDRTAREQRIQIEAVCNTCCGACGLEHADSPILARSYALHARAPR